MDGTRFEDSVRSRVPEHLRDRAVELARNVLWMERKLDVAMREMTDAPLTVVYDNGGGQTGIRKNPEIEAYNSLVSSYTKALKQLCEMLGSNVPEGGDDELDALLAATSKTRETRPC